MKSMIIAAGAIVAATMPSFADEPINGWIGTCEHNICYAKTVGLGSEILVTFDGATFDISIENEFARNTVYNGKSKIITKPKKENIVPARHEDGMRFVFYDISPELLMEIAKDDHLNIGDELIIKVANIGVMGAVMVENLQ